MLNGHVQYLENNTRDLQSILHSSRNISLVEDKNVLFDWAHRCQVFILVQYLHSYGYSTHNMGHYLENKIHLLELNKSSRFSVVSIAA